MMIAHDIHQYIEGSPRAALLAAVSLSYAAYLVGLAIYRLYLSPIAKFPGPKLAALSKWYEFYYDVVLRGNYSDHITELHKIYGPIVRITPQELHVNDPPFHHTLFTKNQRSFKDPWFNPRAGNESSMFSTCDPAHHKLRRAALNPYFSKRAIGQCEDMVQSKIEYACSRILEHKENDKVLNLARMWDAFSGDVIMEYSFSFGYNNLGSENFEETFHKPFLALTEFGMLNCQFPFMGPIMESLPDWFVRMTNPPLDKVLSLIRTLQAKLRAELMDAIPDIQVEGAFNFQKLEGLPYLRGCVKEGIRLAIGVSGRNARILESNLPYRDWIIPAGTSVSMSSQDILLDEDIFPNPGELVPERWVGNPKAPDGSSLERYFVPFGKGDRQCLGINLAHMETFLGLAHIFRKFRLELYETDRSDVVMAHDFFLPSPKSETKGVRVKVVEVFEK